MAGKNGKTTVFAVLGGVLVLFGIIGGVYGVYSEFVTKDEHKKDYNHEHTVMLMKHDEQAKAIKEAEESIAGMSKQIKQNTLQDHIRWLEQQIDEIEAQYGENTSSMPPTIRKRYKKYLRDLEDARATMSKLQGS